MRNHNIFTTNSNSYLLRAAMPLLGKFINTYLCGHPISDRSTVM